MISDSFSHSPYELTQSSLGFEFRTESGEHYALYISDASGYFEGYEFAAHALMPGLARLSAGKRSSHDPRVFATLLHFLERVLEDREAILVYVCDQSDNLQQQRHRLFNRLFAAYNRGSYVKRVLVEDQTLYASLLHHKENPFSEAIAAAIPAIKEKLGF